MHQDQDKSLGVLRKYCLSVTLLMHFRLQILVILKEAFTSRIPYDGTIPTAPVVGRGITVLRGSANVTPV
jgi:hypothetical protein